MPGRGLPALAAEVAGTAPVPAGTSGGLGLTQANNTANASGTVADYAAEIESTFGKVIRELREGFGWTQGQLAERMTAEGMPMTQTVVTKLERGGRPTPVKEVAALGVIFGVSPQRLIGPPDAGGGSPPTSPAGAPTSNWAALCLFAEFAAATGTPLRADRRGGKRGDPHGEAPQGLVGGPVSPVST